MTSRSRPPGRPRMRGLPGKPKHISSYTTSRDAARNRGRKRRDGTYRGCQVLAQVCHIRGPNRRECRFLGHGGGCWSESQSVREAVVVVVPGNEAPGPTHAQPLNQGFTVARPAILVAQPRQGCARQAGKGPPAPSKCCLSSSRWPRVSLSNSASHTRNSDFFMMASFPISASYQFGPQSIFNV